jgi:hypothetical protein
MRLCSKLDCNKREGKGFKCLISIFDCAGERTEAMLLSAGVGAKDIDRMKEEGLLNDEEKGV